MSSGACKLISTAYGPPVQYFRELHQQSAVLVDGHEHFVKQTLRNRMHILSPNGIQSLIIPVVHSKRTNTAVNEILIANQVNWQQQHWRSLESAYRRSAFFEFYADDLEPFYTRKFDLLFEFNTGLLKWMMEQFQLSCTLEFSSSYVKHPDESIADLRSLCNAGDPEPDGRTSSYPQVFSYKAGFTPGLSAFDLIFNMGPACRSYL